ncbi:conserved hypothetical protein [Beutenbergia cavernae DSM 12333]|uniref:DivIVA domain-containing protein n=1 Tax=Beutenbergia cavernae (strain ATCC BAA-8 / DSM 12333 / CCUG 43141 / JCM 11478 / NBRC 16432 / NCIMB 13614 / HKI 0122) TaxID=471853 RepID=C5BWT5_BEUC1|nr:DivIVA domain-containing protein [Beutenbergia cavernae]ACQ80751.1 conserved hypothetical protein [Beutenbergia cavernae DSM 12333]
MTRMFPTVGRMSRGYDREEVDTFFSRARAAYEGTNGAAQLTGQDVRQAAFDLVRHGYSTTAVDAALDRLEAAFVQRERAEFVADRGQAAWMHEVADRATTLYGRLTRPENERFAQPEHGHGYDTEDVDALLDRLVDYFDAGVPLTASEIRSATFRSAPRTRAYAEGPVDAFLDRVVDVLLSVE